MRHGNPKVAVAPHKWQGIAISVLSYTLELSLFRRNAKIVLHAARCPDTTESLYGSNDMGNEE